VDVERKDEKEKARVSAFVEVFSTMNSESEGMESRWNPCVGFSRVFREFRYDGSTFVQ